MYSFNKEAATKPVDVTLKQSQRKMSWAVMPVHLRAS